jgi:hypothetical protein
MDASRFDLWTRRRVGIALGGLLGTALGAASLEAEAKNKKRKKRCRKIRATCTVGGKKCCKSLVCDEVIDLAGTFCCRPEATPCKQPADCCFPTTCFEGFCKPI